MWRSPSILIVTLALLAPCLDRRAMACPNCKEAVAAQPSDAANAARGFNWSVMFMMSMPFTLIGVGAISVIRAARRGAFPEL